MKFSNFNVADSIFRSLVRVICTIAVIFSTGAAQSAFAQNGTVKVTGKVSCNGEGVIGASVMVKGTTAGTVTDMDGRYSINVNPDAVFTVSAIGY